MPRLLWELRDRRPQLTLLLLEVLRRAACFASPGSPMAATLTTLEPELAPFFFFPAAAAKALAAPAVRRENQTQRRTNHTWNPIGN